MRPCMKYIPWDDEDYDADQVIRTFMESYEKNLSKCPLPI